MTDRYLWHPRMLGGPPREVALVSHGHTFCKVRTRHGDAIARPEELTRIQSVSAVPPKPTAASDAPAGPPSRRALIDLRNAPSAMEQFARRSAAI